MSNKKMDRSSALQGLASGGVLWIICLLVSHSLFSSENQQHRKESDPVIEFYWSKACKTFPEIDPELANISFSREYKAFYSFLDSDGSIGNTDSIWAIQYLTGPVLDSQVLINGNKSRFERLSFDWLDIFCLKYKKHLFPNDTGGVRLAIEIIADSTRPNQPDGLLILNRDEYYPLKIYLYYPAEKNFKRLTREFSFVKIDGYLFVESIVETGTYQGIWKSESYRMEVGVTNIDIDKGE